MKSCILLILNTFAFINYPFKLREIERERQREREKEREKEREREREVKGIER